MAETTEYLFLGLAAIVVIMGGLILSFVTRYRSLVSDKATLERLARED
jgi:hypothetical protein